MFSTFQQEYTNTIFCVFHGCTNDSLQMKIYDSFVSFVNSFALLEHLLMLVTSIVLTNSNNKVIGIINSAKPFHNFTEDTGVDRKISCQTEETSATKYTRQNKKRNT